MPLTHSTSDCPLSSFSPRCLPGGHSQHCDLHIYRGGYAAASMMRFNMVNGLNLARTKRFVALVVRPRPDIRGAHIRTLKRRRRNSIDRQAHRVVHPRHVQHARSPHVAASRSPNQPLLCDLSFKHSINDVKNEDIPPESETTTSFSSLAPLYNSSTRSELAKPRILRSSRSRKCKSISDIHTRLSQLKETPGPSTWPRLRDEDETTFSLSSSAFSLFSSQEALEQQCQNSIHATSSHRAFMRSLVTPARHSTWQEYNQSTRNTDVTEYVTANTHLEQSLGNEESLANVSILQAIDRPSGAIFERIHQGRQGEIGAQIVARLLGFTSHVAVEPALAPLHSNKPSTPVIEPSNNCPDRPALMLTIPTPTLPHSPLFVPQSPITVSKFFFATALSTPRPDELASDPALPLSGPLAPSLTSCGHCGLPEFDQGTQCRLCNEHWLACKVWYRANDGGHRRWLTEPYIRPGECNETNRAMMRGLGVVGLSSTLCSLDDVYLKRSKRNSYLPRLSGENIWRSVKNKAILACSLHKPPLRRASKRLSQICKTVSRFSPRQKDLIES